MYIIKIKSIYAPPPLPTPANSNNHRNHPSAWKKILDPRMELDRVDFSTELSFSVRNRRKENILGRCKYLIIHTLIKITHYIKAVYLLTETTKLVGD